VHRQRTASSWIQYCIICAMRYAIAMKQIVIHWHVWYNFDLMCTTRHLCSGRRREDANSYRGNSLESDARRCRLLQDTCVRTPMLLSLILITHQQYRHISILRSVIIIIVPYGLWEGNAPSVICGFRRVINCLFIYSFLIYSTTHVISTLQAS